MFDAETRSSIKKENNRHASNETDVCAAASSTGSGSAHIITPNMELERGVEAVSCVFVCSVMIVSGQSGSSECHQHETAMEILSGAQGCLRSLPQARRRVDDVVSPAVKVLLKVVIKEVSLVALRVGAAGRTLFVSARCGVLEV